MCPLILNECVVNFVPPKHPGRFATNRKYWFISAVEIFFSEKMVLDRRFLSANFMIGNFNGAIMVLIVKLINSAFWLVIEIV